MKLYIASSWRNDFYPHVLKLVRSAGHLPYDFRNPSPGLAGFSWSEIDPKWQQWTPEQYRSGLDHERALNGLAADRLALDECGACLLVMPCGRSAHLELGYAIGRRKKSAVFYPTDVPQACDGKIAQFIWEPELMAGMADHILVGTAELVSWLVGLR